MSITISANNNTSITVNPAATDTIKSILQNAQVMQFFCVGNEDTVVENFEYYEDPTGSQVDMDVVLTAVPEDGSIISVDLPGRVAAAAPAATPVGVEINGAAAIPVTGTILVKWNGGMNSVTLTDIRLGVDSVATVLQNGYIANRFGTTTAQLSAADITLESNGNVTRVSQAAAANRLVSNGDTIWLQARAADDKGRC